MDEFQINSTLNSCEPWFGPVLCYCLLGFLNVKKKKKKCTKKQNKKSHKKENNEKQKKKTKKRKKTKIQKKKINPTKQPQNPPKTTQNTPDLKIYFAFSLKFVDWILFLFVKFWMILFHFLAKKTLNKKFWLKKKKKKKKRSPTISIKHSLVNFWLELQIENDYFLYYYYLFTLKFFKIWISCRNLKK